MAVKKGLGMGMNDLLGTSNAAKTRAKATTNKEANVKADGQVLEVDILLVNPNKGQPRKQFNEDKINELADSIGEHGIVQPLIVSQKKDAKKNVYYQIIAGERRWRAAKIAGLKKIPVIVKEYTEDEELQVALIENIQREDLNPIEEALAYDSLIKKLKITQDGLAEKVSKSRTAITNSLRLLKLSKKVQNMVIEDKLSAGHVRALLAIEDKSDQYDIAQEVFDKGLSVRDTERLVKRYKEGKTSDNKEVKKDPKLEAIKAAYKEKETEIKNKLKTKVTIKDSGNKGQIVISYGSLDEFERLYKILNK
ncbi:MAG: ParB/RepB/Spo0J family partition protein [Lachnospiraceae bacterium]|jgi:ParB family chromosome partitioning protein|nr:ParB/RepB/Spo0J family partition protein [Lachnospiraceae bacterium]